MKKLATLSLLAVFLFNSFGYYLAFCVAQKQNRAHIERQIKMSVPERELIAISIEKEKLSGIDWRNKGKEFVLNGKSYDVVKSKESDQVTTFYCVSDELESGLYGLLEDFSEEANGERSDKNTLKKLNDLSSLFYFNFNSPYEFRITDRPFEFPVASETYTSAITEISSPPPQLA